MLLSDGTVLSRLVKTLAGIALAGTLAGCQVRPLYSASSDTDGKLASIAISEAGDRIEQQVRNDLVFLFSGSGAEAQNAVYHLEMDVTSKTVGVMNDVKTDTARSGRVTVTADYNLTRSDSGETVVSGKRSAVAMMDFPTQEFGKVRSVRDAENRGARELAELIRADVAAALARR